MTDLTDGCRVPVYEIIAEAIKSSSGTTVLAVLLTSVAVLTLLGSVLSASRIT